MSRRGLLLGVLAGLACALAITVGHPATAEVFSTDALTIIGDGVTVACDTTPAEIQDADVADDRDRWLVCTNDSAGKVRISTGTPTAATPATRSGGRWAAKLAPTVTAKCYAASTMSIQCQEMK